MNRDALDGPREVAPLGQQQRLAACGLFAQEMGLEENLGRERLVVSGWC